VCLVERSFKLNYDEEIALLKNRVSLLVEAVASLIENVDHMSRAVELLIESTGYMAQIPMLGPGAPNAKEMVSTIHKDMESMKEKLSILKEEK